MLQKTPGTLLTVLAPGRQREAVTVWGLLVWAYKRELVRLMMGRVADVGGAGGSNTSAVCRVLESGIVGSGPLARIASFPVHADAEWLHGLVQRLDRDEFWMIVNTAERGEPPQWEPHIEPWRAEPVLRANGKPRMIVDPVSRRPVACMLRWHGHSTAEAAAMTDKAREAYRVWFGALWSLREKILEEDALTRWRITGLGAEPAPWGQIEAEGC